MPVWNPDLPPVAAPGGRARDRESAAAVRRGGLHVSSLCRGGPLRRPAGLGQDRFTSELGELGKRSGDPGLLRAEVHQHGEVALDADDLAEAVTVMRHLVMQRILLNRPGRWAIVEGAAGQITPGRGAGSTHHSHYAAR